MDAQLKKVRTFTKKAKSPTAARQWKHVFNSAKSRGADEQSAVMQASGVIKKRMARSRAKRSGGKR